MPAQHGAGQCWFNSFRNLSLCVYSSFPFIVRLLLVDLRVSIYKDILQIFYFVGFICTYVLFKRYLYVRFIFLWLKIQTHKSEVQTQTQVSNSCRAIDYCEWCCCFSKLFVLPPYSEIIWTLVDNFLSWRLAVLIVTNKVGGFTAPQVEFCKQSAPVPGNYYILIDNDLNLSIIGYLLSLDDSARLSVVSNHLSCFKNRLTYSKDSGWEVSCRLKERKDSWWNEGKAEVS
jgi:hypothetical protein